ncbi:MAG: hypothetical protein PHI12_07870 [Dehalococcoidales bacterium]|jgi:hypothetical protein|nr:hypothetical protein [Dehalococcoidales bacterium]
MDDKIAVDRLINENISGLYGHLYAGVVTHVIITPGEPRAEPQSADTEGCDTIDVVLIYDAHPEGRHPDLQVENFNVTSIELVGLDGVMGPMVDYELPDGEVIHGFILELDSGDDNDQIGLAEIEVFNGWCRALVITGRARDDTDVMILECGRAPSEQPADLEVVSDVIERTGENGSARTYNFNMVAAEHIETLIEALEKSTHPRWIIFTEVSRDIYLDEVALDNLSELEPEKIIKLTELPSTAIKALKRIPTGDQNTIFEALIDSLGKTATLREMLVEEQGIPKMIGAANEAPAGFMVDDVMYYAYKLS